MKYNYAFSEKLLKFQQEQIQPVTDELNIYSKEFAEKRRYDIIWGTVQGGNILYGNDKMDVTKEFLKYVNAK